jgi:MoxR-like ATPase
VKVEFTESGWKEKDKILQSEIRNLKSAVEAIQASVGRVIVGKNETVELMLLVLLCEGHVLIEDVPGIGKTTLAKALARSLGLRFRRIQFTPDLLPSDITGTSVFNQKLSEFEYRPGPVMTQILLADEINRAGPRTQSALLEGMQERQVTVDGVTRPLPRPFMVIATQNPIELEGTFPLPEAQIDRFLMRVALGYPEEGEERDILRRFREADPLEELASVVDSDVILQLQQIVRRVYVHQTVEGYILRLTRATRRTPDLRLGVSPRGSMALYRTSQALAAIRGRAYVIPDDVKYLARPTLAHRLIPSSRTRLRGQTADQILSDLITELPVPVEEVWSEGDVP